MRFWSLILAGALATGTAAAQSNGEAEFPVAPVLFVDEPFRACEGIAFNGEGRLFVSCNQGLWEVLTNGDAARIADLDSHLGIAGYGDRDLLVADFGPTNAFRHGRNSDGVVWRISPEGDKSEHSTGFGDPNFVLVRRDGSYLVSDDATADIYSVSPDGKVALFTTAVNHPNGLALTDDGSTLFVAQIFTNIRPVVMDNALWSMALVDGKPARDAVLEVRADPEGAVDGLAMDRAGRVYIAANRAGRIWRYDPDSREMVLIAEGMPGVASLAFGEGEFDSESIYATTTYTFGKGGKLWRVPVGATGAALYR